jgi:hypothetical protein
MIRIWVLFVCGGGGVFTEATAVDAGVVVVAALGTAVVVTSAGVEDLTTSLGAEVCTSKAVVELLPSLV